MIALTTQFDAIHSESGRIVKVVGTDGTSAFSPKLVLVADVDGTHVEALDYVRNKRPGHNRATTRPVISKDSACGRSRKLQTRCR
ncbi:MULTISPECIES: chitinase N-terminal domain-containing protein [unclassified Mesorhizobium]|uniref:chitinase N-terminal domain-containing protein n=1 Tax=unclassified Mesorhizobium TaxID=325217 RepID=UPI003337E40C